MARGLTDPAKTDLKTQLRLIQYFVVFHDFGDLGWANQEGVRSKTGSFSTNYPESTSLTLKPDGDATSDRPAPGQQLRKYLFIFRIYLSV